MAVVKVPLRNLSRIGRQVGAHRAQGGGNLRHQLGADGVGRDKPDCSNHAAGVPVGGVGNLCCQLCGLANPYP